jgi:hypothetical protein
MTLNFTYAAEPATLVNLVDIPEIPGEQQPHLPDFAYWFLRLPEGGAEHQISLQYLNRFLDAAQKYGDFVRAKSQGQLYDNEPFDLKSFDRSRFIVKLKQEAMRLKPPSIAKNERPRAE